MSDQEIVLYDGSGKAVDDNAGRPSMVKATLLVFCLGCVFTLIGYVAHEIYDRLGRITLTNTSESPFVVTPPLQPSLFTALPPAVSLPEVKASVKRAFAEWEKAVGPLPFSVPDIYINTAGVGCKSGHEVACADLMSHRIIVGAGRLPPECRSLDLVMLHEMGHIIGVPHILGDPVMNATCVEAAPAGLTEESIALARVAIKKRYRRPAPNE